MSTSDGMNWRTILLGSRASGWSILVRLLVGLVVFFPEGIQKLVFPDILGAGRFATIGIPYPNLMGPFVGGIETICGALIVLGLFTRRPPTAMSLRFNGSCVHSSVQACSVRMRGVALN